MGNFIKNNMKLLFGIASIVLAISASDSKLELLTGRTCK